MTSAQQETAEMQPHIPASQLELVATTAVVCAMWGGMADDMRDEPSGVPMPCNA